MQMGGGIVNTEWITPRIETNDLFFAWGYGGQFIFVIPHLQTVVVSTAGNLLTSTVVFDFLEKYVLASVQSD